MRPRRIWSHAPRLTHSAFCTSSGLWGTDSSCTCTACSSLRGPCRLESTVTARCSSLATPPPPPPPPLLHPPWEPLRACESSAKTGSLYHPPSADEQFLFPRAGDTALGRRPIDGLLRASFLSSCLGRARCAVPLPSVLCPLLCALCLEFARGRSHTPGPPSFRQSLLWGLPTCSLNTAIIALRST